MASLNHYLNLIAMPLKNEDYAKAKEIMAFLEKNYRENYSYDDLVKKFGMNNFKLKLAFKVVAGDNVHEFVSKIRIEHAKVYLESTDKTMRVIAARVGLDKSNLYRQFKKLTGKSPKEWRNNHGDNTDLSLKNTGT